MTAIRFTKGLCCIAATLMLCGAPALAQDTMGTPVSPQTAPGGASPGSMPGRPAGGVQGTPGMPGDAGMDASSSTKASAEDKSFMQAAMEGDMAEIQLGQLAQQKASSAEVKQFAQHMIDDHTRLDAEMKPLAHQLGVEAPTELSAKHKSLQATLQGLSGPQFDEEYVKAMVAGHREVDQEFVREETASTNPILKNAVTQAEPTVASHLKMAQDLQKSLNSKGSM